MSMEKSARIYISSDVSDNVHPTLLALATAARYHAQQKTYVNLLLYFISFVLCAGAVIPNEQLAWFLVIFAFFFKVASLFIAAQAETLHSLSREAQRLALLEDSFARNMEPFRTVELRRQMGPRLEAEARSLDYTQPYYRSQRKYGPPRLAENIQQSTFWSRHLLQIYARKLLIGLVVSATIVGATVYFLLVLSRDSQTFTVNPYLLSLAALTLLMGSFDFISLYFACRSSVGTLNVVDQRLDIADMTNNESLLASFADYSIASVTAPPIPYRIYLKNKEYLVNLWHQRMTKNNLFSSINKAGNIPEVVLEDVITFGHLSKDDFLNLILSAARSLAETARKPMPNSVRVSSLIGLSGIPVFEIKMFQKGVLWRQLVLRLNSSSESAKNELAILKRISAENVDVISYSPLEEPFVSQGALFYYHANIQTNDELSSLDDFVIHFLDSPKPRNFTNYFNKLFTGLKNVAKVYDSIEDYSVMSIAEISTEMQNRLPPMYVLDLRTMPYSLNGDELCVLSSQEVGSRAKPVVNMEILQVHHDSPDLLALDVSYKNDKCRCILDATKLPMLRRINRGFRLIQNSMDRIQKLKEYMMIKNNLSIDPFNAYEVLRHLSSQEAARQALHFGFRHKDLHCDNCLASRSNFKIVDVGDSGRALICCDIARLEISLFSRVVHKMGLSDQSVNDTLQLLDGTIQAVDNPTIRLLAAVIRGIRECFLSQMKITAHKHEIAIAYFLECCDQLSFSILSPISLKGGAASIVAYWNQHAGDCIRGLRKPKLKENKNG